MPKNVTKKTATKKAAPRAKRKPTKKAYAAPQLAAETSHFTDDQIRARAYEIYRRSANPSDPTADWFQAVQELSSESGA